MSFPEGYNDLLPHHGYAVMIEGFLDAHAANALYHSLADHVPWEQRTIRIFGREVPQPRLTAWYGDGAYTYSGLTLQPLPWDPLLIVIRDQITRRTGNTFNSALLNYYRHGNDSVGWHRDNERSLGDQPFIASLSLGAEREMRFRDYHTKQDQIKLKLTNGSLLCMGGRCQEHWEHALPKVPSLKEGRINITFRTITANDHA